MRIDITGVTPLPAAMRSNGSSKDLGVKTPDGGSTSTWEPGARLSQTQLDPYPSTVRFTVTLGRASVYGDEASE